MNFFKNLGLLSAAGFAVAALSGVAHANDTIAQLSGTSGATNDINFNGTTLTSIAGGVLVTASGPTGMPASPFAGAKFNFGPLTFVAGSANQTTIAGVTITTANFTTVGQPTPNFSIFDASNNLLLSGNFGSAVLSSASNSSGTLQSIGFNTVTYTGGSFLNYYLASKPAGSTGIGTFGVTLSSVTPGFGVTGNNLNAFTSGASGATFDVTTVPEPGEWAGMGAAALSLMGLMGAARFRRRNSVAAA